MGGTVGGVVGFVIGVFVGATIVLENSSVVVVEKIDRVSVVEYSGQKHKLVPVKIKKTVEIVE